MPQRYSSSSWGLMTGFVKMKWNKSSEVIPLRPRVSDAKEMLGTEHACLPSLLERHARCVIIKVSSEAPIPLCLFLLDTLTGEIPRYSNKHHVTLQRIRRRRQTFINFL